MILRYGKRIPLNVLPGTLVKWIRLDGQTGFGTFISYNSNDPLRPLRVTILSPEKGIITEKINMYFRIEAVE